MNSIWKNLYNPFKDRRNGFLFLLCLLAVLSLAVLVALAAASAEDDLVRLILLYAMVVAGGGLLACLWKTVSRILARSNDRPGSSRLSSDEVAKARSKLLKQRSRRSL